MRRQARLESHRSGSIGMVMVTGIPYSGTKACLIDTAIEGPGVVKVDYRTYEIHSPTNLHYVHYAVHQLPLLDYNLLYIDKIYDHQPKVRYICTVMTGEQCGKGYHCTSHYPRAPKTTTCNYV